MSSYSIPHGSTSDSNSSTCSSIQTNREMQQLCDVADRCPYCVPTTILEDGEQVETPENPFAARANIHTIEAFMNRVGYQGVVDKKKEAIQYPRFTKLIIADLMKMFPNIPKRIKEDYHSIKDDIPLVSVYTTGNVSVREMLILDAFLTAEIRETNDFKEYETVFMKVAILMNQP
ncbi:hypothetical protein Tco_0353036 [Tanacetum coccineum]